MVTFYIKRVTATCHQWLGICVIPTSIYCSVKVLLFESVAFFLEIKTELNGVVFLWFVYRNAFIWLHARIHIIQLWYLNFFSKEYQKEHPGPIQEFLPNIYIYIYFCITLIIICECPNTHVSRRFYFHSYCVTKKCRTFPF